MEKLKQLVEDNPFIKAIEIKLSQGAKPGKGGVLPGAKITQEIANIRGVEVGKDVLSPPNHSAFSNVEGLFFLNNCDSYSNFNAFKCPASISSA